MQAQRTNERSLARLPVSSSAHCKIDESKAKLDSIFVVELFGPNRNSFQLQKEYFQNNNNNTCKRKADHSNQVKGMKYITDIILFDTANTT